MLTRAGRDIAFFLFTLFMFLSCFMIIGMQFFGSSIEGFTSMIGAGSMLMQAPPPPLALLALRPACNLHTRPFAPSCRATRGVIARWQLSCSPQCSPQPC